MDGRPGDYLSENADYWERGMDAPHVESHVFRLFGRTKADLGLTGEGETAVDFGCGQGAAVNFLTMQGLNAWGCDICTRDLEIARIRYPHIARKFVRCDPQPNRNPFYAVAQDVACVTAFESLYYFSNSDFDTCIAKLRSSLRPGGAIMASMIGEQASDYFDTSQPEHDGLRRVSLQGRVGTGDLSICMNFVRNEAHLVERFQGFQPLHIGYYSGKYRQSDRGDTFHWTFVGRKSD